MTAAAFANLVCARSVGRGRWMARCPAHDDRSPSLSIREGRDGRVLAHCFGGCALDAVIAALGLSCRDLFAGPQPSPQQARVAAIQRTRREAEQDAIRQERRSNADRFRRLTAVVESIGDRLARMPDNSPAEKAMTRLFHTALERQRDAESELEAPR